MTTLNLTFHNRVQAIALIKEQMLPFLAQVLQGGHRWILTLKPETRTQAQNRLMWPLLTAFSQQLEWPINGRMGKVDENDWKDILTAAFHEESVRLAMGLNGGVVLLGQRTSKFSKVKFSEFIEFLFATAADRGVKLPEMEAE